jgi:hypothetical protein
MKAAFQIGIFAALAASGLTAWLSPHLITWYFTPPVEMSVSCKEAVAWGIDVYQKLTLGTALLTGIVTFFIVLVKRSKNPPPATTTVTKTVNT